MKKNAKNLTQAENVQQTLMENQEKLYALICMLMLRNKQDAMDVLQRTNTAILEHPERYVPEKPIWAWFSGIAMNQVKSYFHNAARSPLVYDTDLVDTLSGEASEKHLFHGADMEEYLDALHHCMAKLPPMKRDLLQERYMDDRDILDLSAKYHLSVASLAHFFSRVRRALQRCIQSVIHIRGVWQGAQAAQPPSDSEDEDFSCRLALYLDGDLTQEQGAAFEEELAGSAAKRSCYMEESVLSTFLSCEKQRLFGQRARPRPTYRIAARVAAIAAGLALLLAGGAALFPRRPAARILPMPKPAPQAVAAIPQKVPAPKPAKPAGTVAQTLPAVPTNFSVATVAAKVKEEEPTMNAKPVAAIVTAAAMTAALVPPPAAQAVNITVRSQPANKALSAASTLDARMRTVSRADSGSLDARQRTLFRSAAKGLNTNKIKGTVIYLM